MIRTAAKETDKFAKVMNLTKKEVDDMINKDPLEFFLKFAEGAKGLDTTELAKMLDYLKLNDQYVISTMGAASENTDKFRASIELSNKSLSEATSLQKEFDKVNNNSAAIYEKVQKQLAGLFSNEYVAKGLNWLIEGFGLLIGAGKKSEEQMSTFGAVVLGIVRVLFIAVAAMGSVSVAFALYNALVKESIVKTVALDAITKGRNITTQISAVVQNLYNKSVGVGADYLSVFTSMLGFQTTATKLQTVAQDNLNKVTKANPFGAVLAVVTLLVTAYMTWKQYANNAADAQKNLNELSKEGAKNAATEVNNIDQVYKKLTDKNIAEKERIELLAKIKKEYPGYFQNLTTEDFLVGKAKKSYLELRDAIIAAAQAKAAQSEIDKIAAEYLEKEVEIEKKMKEAYIRGKTGKETYLSSQAGERALGKHRFEEEAKNLKQLYKERNEKMQPYIDYKTSAEKRSSKLNGNKDKPEYNSNYTIPDSASASSADAQKSTLKKQHDDLMKWLKEQGKIASQQARQIQLNIEEAEIEAMKDGFDKEMAQLNFQEKQKIESIENRKYDKAQIDDLQKKINSASKNDKKYFEALMASWVKNNDSLEKEKEGQTAIFEIKRQTLNEKYALKRLKEEEDNFKFSLEILNREKNEKLVALQTLADQKAFLQDKTSAEELAKITTLEEGKAAIEKYYKAESLKRQVEFLKQKEAELSAMVAINAQLGVLDPSQIKTIEDYKNQISELLVEIDQLKTGKTGKHGKKDKEKGSLKGIGGETDLLGLTPDQWETMFSNNEELATGLDKAKAGIVAMQNAFGMYFQFVEANQKRELQRFEQRTTQKKNTYKKQLLEGYINQETYKKLSLKADQDLDKKKAEMALKAAQRERQMQIMSIIGGTASAVVGALGNKPWTPANFVLAGIVGAIGAVQLATTLATPLPTADGYEDGFGMEYPIERAQDGKKFNVRRKRLSSRLVDRPTHFIAGENNKVEMVIDNPTWTSYPDELKRAIYSANARAKGFENGFNTIGGTGKQTESNDDVMIMLISTVNRMNTTLDNIEKNGIQAKIAKTARNGKEVQDMQKMYDQLNNKNKHG